MSRHKGFASYENIKKTLDINLEVTYIAALSNKHAK